MAERQTKTRSISLHIFDAHICIFNPFTFNHSSNTLCCDTELKDELPWRALDLSFLQTENPDRSHMCFWNYLVWSLTDNPSQTTLLGRQHTGHPQRRVRGGANMSDLHTALHRRRREGFGFYRFFVRWLGAVDNTSSWAFYLFVLWRHTNTIRYMEIPNKYACYLSCVTRCWYYFRMYFSDCAGKKS